MSDSFAGPNPTRVECVPDLATWPTVTHRTREAIDAWSFEIAGVPIRDARARARADVLAIAASAAERMGLAWAHSSAGCAERPLIVTGHQPELFHPGVWSKVFTAQHAAKRVGGIPLDVVVDTDASKAVTLKALRDGGLIERVEIPLAVANEDQPFHSMRVPDEEARRRFANDAIATLSTLPSQTPLDCFNRFVDALDVTTALARDLPECVVAARRRIELAADTDVPSVPMSDVIRTRSFQAFAAHLLIDHENFARIYDAALADFRVRHRTRSVAQPFPDLQTGTGLDDTIFWVEMLGSRKPLRVRTGDEDSLVLVVGDEALSAVPRTVEAVIDVIGSSDMLVSPKAVALTLFLRLLVADLFVHGTGGGRYDEVTDAVIRDYLGVEPPMYAVSTLTMALDAGIESDGSQPTVPDARERLNRFRMNPDTFVDDAVARGVVIGGAVDALVAEKRRLIAELAVEGADRKTLGIRVKQVNASIAAALSTVEAELETAIESAEEAGRRRTLVTARDYSFCLYPAEEVVRSLM